MWRRLGGARRWREPLWNIKKAATQRLCISRTPRRDEPRRCLLYLPACLLVCLLVFRSCLLLVPSRSCLFFCFLIFFLLCLSLSCVCLLTCSPVCLLCLLFVSSHFSFTVFSSFFLFSFYVFLDLCLCLNLCLSHVCLQKIIEKLFFNS